MLKTLSLIALALLPVPGGAAFEPLNRIVAIVNNDVIAESQLEEREALIIKQLEESDTPLPPADQLRQQVLERLVIEDLQLQMAQQNGVVIDDERLNSGLRAMAKENGLTLSEFRDQLEAEGYDYATFREQVRTEISIARLRQQLVENRIQVTDQEVDNLLANAARAGADKRAFHLAHILISVPEEAGPDDIAKAEERASAILEKLRAGADFSETAVAESDGRQALEGGDLGWREADKLPSLFTGVVRKMKKGEISDLIRSPSGFHIVKVKDTRGGESHLITQTLARHILIKPSVLLNEEDARIRIEQIAERIQLGDDFAKLARTHSDDTGSASAGGDLGWVNPGEMVPEFEKEMNELEPGQVSKPVQSRFGWHLIQVLERRSKDNSEDYRRMQARESIRKRKVDEETEVWLRRLRDESYIEFVSAPPP
jgi:peptidyl-prolyl cis-trans isomerase SurA